jgi:hypothetical protein
VVGSGFTAGDVVVYRLGDGSTALSGNGAPVFLDEYSPTGTLVQSVPLPTTASGSNKPLVGSGSANSEGMLTLSANDSDLVATGYDAAVGASNLSSSAAASVPRTVAVVNGSDTVNTSTALTDFADGNNPRSAVSDNGTNLWLGGAAGGVRFATVGSSTSTSLVSSTFKNIRQVAIANGQLYASSDPTKAGLTIATVGTGLPTSGSSNAVTNLTFSSAPVEPYAYSFVTLGSGTAPDTLYVADNSAGAIVKYGLSSGTWAKEGSVAVSGVTGVTADDASGVVSIFATTSGASGTAGTLYSITDSSGQGGTLTGTATAIVTASTNEAFRGVAFAPGTVFGSGGPPPPPPAPTITTAQADLPAAMSDPTNPTLGITVGDASVPASELTVTATSSNTSVAPQSGLSITGSGASRTLTVTPGTAVGYSTIALTVSAPGSSSTTTDVSYGLSAYLGDPSDRYFSGAGNASAAIDVGGGYMIVADDENNVLRLYHETQSGPPVKTFDFTSVLPHGTTEIDIEAAARSGNTLYWTGSMSNNSSGDLAPARSTLFAATITGSGANTTLTYVGSYSGLQTDLVNWDVNNGHGLGANYLGLNASVNGGVDSHEINALNVEGMEFAGSSSTTAYLAFRAPLEPTTNRHLALVVPVTNIDNLVTGAATAATFGAPMFWDLGGLGVRDIKENADGQYLVIAGTPDGTNSSFVLYTWDGNPSDAPVQTNTTLPLIPAGANQGSWETIVSVPDPLTSGSNVQLLEDNGDTAWYGDTATSKTTLPADLQKDLGRVFSYSPPTANSVVITADNQTRAYGTPDPTLTFTTTGLTGSDTFTTPPTCAVSGDDSAVGTYAINCSGATTSSPNDTISYVAGTLTVSKSPVTVAVTADSNPAVTGQAVTFTATVAPSQGSSGSIPTGSVEFVADGMDLPGCAAVTLAAGAASCPASAGLAAGPHSVVVSYSGDSSYAAGDNSASPFAETVDPASTTMSLTADPSSPAAGQPVDVTATVAVVAPGSSTPAVPTGTVEFQVGGTDIADCSAVAVDTTGDAVCHDAAGIAADDNTVSAAYSGDSNFTSATTTLTVSVSPATYLFVDENPNGPNEVRNYRVNGDGTTTLVGAYPTGHPGDDASWVAAGRSALAQTTGFLYALNLGDQTISVFSVDPNTGALTLVGTSASVDATAIAVNPAGTVLYAGGSTNTGTLDQLSSYAIGSDGMIGATPVATVPADVDGLSVSPDGSEVAAAYPGTSPTTPGVQVWSTDTSGDLTAVATAAQPCPTDVRFASDTTLDSASCYAGALTSYTLGADQLTVSGSTAAASQTLAVGPDGTVFFDTGDGLQGAQETAGSFTTGPATAYPTDQSITTMAVSPDGSRLFVASFNDATINDYAIGADHALNLLEQITIPAGLPTVIAYTPTTPTDQPDQADHDTATAARQLGTGDATNSRHRAHHPATTHQTNQPIIRTHAGRRRMTRGLLRPIRRAS